MDDSSGSTSTIEVLEETLKEIQKLLPYGGFQLKVITRSGEDPNEKASADGKTVTFAGYRWAPKEDNILLGFGELNFNAKCRGIKKPNEYPIDTDDDVEKLVSDMKLTR